MIFWCTNIRPLNYRMHNVAQVQTRTGKFRLFSGRLFFIALTRVNRLEKLQGSMASRMKLFDVFFALLVENNKQDKEPFLSLFPDRPPASIRARVCTRVSTPVAGT